MAFSEEQVTQAITALAGVGGSPAEAIKLLDFEISATTLTKWRDEVHPQRYADAARRVQTEIEADTVVQLRALANRALEIERDLLERAAKANYRDVPQALRAVADVQAKSVDKLLALTGRAPEQQDNGGDMRQLLEGMADKGLITLNVNLTAPAKEIPSDTPA